MKLFEILFVELFLTLLVFSEIQKEDGIDKFGRPYSLFNLENGMNVVLVQDEKFVVGSLALHVAAGSMNDPPEVQGLSNLLLNLIYSDFEGSQKIPVVYAQPGADSTVYKWNIRSDRLEEGLNDIVGAMFHPIFSQGTICKIMDSVESQYKDGLSDLLVKKIRLLKLTARHGHPFTQFTIGNRNTLLTIPQSKGINVTERLYDFHQKHYVPSKMSLAIIVKNELNDVQELVEKYFGSLHGEGEEPEVWEDAWGEAEMGTKVEMAAPQGQGQNLTVFFNIKKKEIADVFDRYYGPLFKFECGECLYGYLRKKGWITGDHIVATSYRYYRHLYVAWVKLSLTDTGYQHQEEVVAAVFQFIALLKESGPQQWFWDQQFALNFLDQYHANHMSEGIRLPQDQVGELAEALLATDKVHSPLQKEWTAAFPRTEIQDALAYMIPSNLRLAVVSNRSNIKTTMYDELYDIHYNYEPLEHKLFEDWCKAIPGSEMKFPTPLEGIPESIPTVDMKKPDYDHPSIIFSSNHSELWYTSKNPGYKRVQVRGTVFSHSPDTSVWDKILGCMLTQAFKWCYNSGPSYLKYRDGLLGNYFFRTNWGNGKIDWEMSGPSSTVLQTFKTFLYVLNNLCLDEETFQSIKDELRNQLLKSSQKKGCSVEKMVILERYCTTDETLAALNGLSLLNLQEFHRKIFSQISLRWLIYGYVDVVAAKNSVKEFEEAFVSVHKSKPLSKDFLNARYREIQIPKGVRHQMNFQCPVNHSACTRVLFQTDGHTLRDAAYLGMIVHLLSYPKLQHQNHVVEVKWRDLVTRGPGISWTLQLTVKELYDQGWIDTFLEGVAKEVIRNLTEARFLAEIASYKSRLEAFDRDRLWDEICYAEPGDTEKMMAMLTSSKPSDISDYFDVSDSDSNSQFWTP